MGVKWLSRLLLLSILLIAGNSMAVEIHGRSSSQFMWFNDIFTEQSQLEIGQYLQLGITNIDKEGKFSVYGYGRGSQDLTNGDGINGRLYYLYVDYRDFLGKFDFRAGRQFVNIAAGNALIDGARINFKNIGPVALTILGGRNVIFGQDGELTKSEDAVFGVAGNLVGLKYTDLELGYFVKWNDGSAGPARETLGGSFKQYLFNSLKLYTDARYDLYAEVFSEVLAGVKYFPMPNLILTGEWFQSYPTFDADSIYAVFAVDRYQEGVLRADYRINDMVSVNGGFNVQEYGNEGMAYVYEVGCRVTPIEPLVINLAYDRRTGYNGSLDGGTIDAVYDFNKKLQLAAGMQFDVYNREDIVETGHGIARKYWGGAKYRITDKMTASVRVEDNVNENYSSDWQGRVVFNYDF